MNTWNQTVLTNKGEVLEAKLMEGETFRITGVFAGAGKVSVSELKEQEDVTERKQELTMQVDEAERNEMKLKVLLENSGLVQGYVMHQIGIYAQDPDEGEILYCIAQTEDGKIIPSGEESPGFSITWNFQFQHSNATTLEVDINPAGLVSIEQYYEISRKVEQIQKDLLEKVYPVGSVFISATDISPAGIFGGVWERFGNGRTLMGVNENDTLFQSVGRMGGHKELQSHNHGFVGNTVGTSTSGSHSHTFTGTAASTNTAGNHSHTVRNVHFYEKAVAKGSNYARWNSDGSAVTNDWGDVTYSGNHTHSLTARGYNSTDGNHNHTVAVSGSVQNAGGGNAGNLPPFITVYIWKRIS